MWLGIGTSVGLLLRYNETSYCIKLWEHRDWQRMLPSEEGLCFAALVGWLVGFVSFGSVRLVWFGLVWFGLV